MLINKINLSFLKNNFNIFILVIDNFDVVFVDFWGLGGTGGVELLCE